MRIESFSLSDVGRTRTENQDRTGHFPDRRIYVVADGMGGHAGGKVASDIAVTTIEERVAVVTQPLPPLTLDAEIASLGHAVREINRRIRERSAAESELRGMGTTLVLLLLRDDPIGAILHVGDSRAYRLRNGAVEQLTTDHSIVNDLLKNREISEDEARSHPYRHVLTRALGAAEDITADVTRIEVREEDVYLLCSDGVYGMLSPEELLAILSRHRTSPRESCNALIAAANAAGGKDNASAIVVYCSSGR